jgi:pyruvate/2-oxoglutarate dehydrogenase complex dihydrolipoamide acyltransferase (E2) component
LAIKTIILEIDVEEGEEGTVKELLAYLAYTKRIKKYLWREKEQGAFKHAAHAPAKLPEADKQQPVKAEDKPAPKHQEHAAPKHALPKKAEAPHMVEALSEKLAEWKKQDKLIRLKALKGKGKMLDIACKIVSQDADTGIVTVYDVDRKVVETVRVTEIEDINLAL